MWQGLKVLAVRGRCWVIFTHNHRQHICCEKGRQLPVDICSCADWRGRFKCSTCNKKSTFINGSATTGDCRGIQEDLPLFPSTFSSSLSYSHPIGMVCTLSKARGGKCQWGWAGKYELENNFQPVIWACKHTTEKIGESYDGSPSSIKLIFWWLQAAVHSSFLIGFFPPGFVVLSLGKLRNNNKME